LLKRVIVIFGLSFAGSAYAVDEDAADPNKAIVEMIQVAPADPQSNDCVVKITADFAKFYERLPIFRNAFLNHDFSIDFYKQRRKQVFSFTILRRVAELITEGLYRGQSTPICRFSITVDYLDKFGQDRMFEALTWRFNNEQAAKINWEKFDRCQALRLLRPLKAATYFYSMRMRSLFALRRSAKRITWTLKKDWLH
jgi:hypothetical protein